MHAHDVELSPGSRRLLIGITIAIAALVTVGITFVGFRTEVDAAGAEFLVGTVYEARVTGIDAVLCAGTDIECIDVEVELTQGPDEGETRTLTFTRHEPTTPDLSTGDRIVLSYSEDAEEGFEYDFADRQRRSVLLAASLLFAVAVVLLGRLRGLAALGGLVASIYLIMVFVLPAILDGYSPVLVAVLGSAAIAYVALYLAHGFNMLTTVALLGTLASLALTVALSAIFTAFAEFSGFATEEAVLVGNLVGGVDMSGLVLAGIVIGALGALDDVTVTQASAVAELREANPTMPHRALYTGALRIGRDHIASTVNTLALAYVGAALPLLLLFTLSQQSLGTIANSEVMATEIVRTMVGSIGLVASVPITTWLASRVVRGPTGVAPPPRPPRSVIADDDGEQSFWG